jgi:hypothetical protein
MLLLLHYALPYQHTTTQHSLSHQRQSNTAPRGESGGMCLFPLALRARLAQMTPRGGGVVVSSVGVCRLM